MADNAPALFSTEVKALKSVAKVAHCDQWLLELYHKIQLLEVQIFEDRKTISSLQEKIAQLETARPSFSDLFKSNKDSTGKLVQNEAATTILNAVKMQKRRNPQKGKQCPHF